jgi:lipid-A-disaccharide synthase
VGHPLADLIPLEPDRRAARQALALPEDATLVALLPGSRRSEIQYIAPALLQAAGLMQAARPDIRFVLPVAPGLDDLLRPLAATLGPQGLELLPGRSHEALAACDLTLIASGTATLEAALFKRPMVIAYRMHPLSWQLMKRMAYQPWVGLPNILCREFIVPELIQEACTPQGLAQEGLRWLAQDGRRGQLRERFMELHHQLRCDTATRATDAIAKIIKSA